MLSIHSGTVRCIDVSSSLNSFNHMVTLFFQSEAQLMSGIIADKHHRSVFDNIIQEGLDSVIKNGEVLKFILIGIFKEISR